MGQRTLYVLHPLPVDGLAGDRCPLPRYLPALHGRGAHEGDSRFAHPRSPVQRGRARFTGACKSRRGRLKFGHFASS